MSEGSGKGPVQFGRYALVRRIGAGGMGEVFLAREESQGRARACVLKKVLPNLAQNRAFVGRFLDEAKVVVRLNHPNIARVYAMGDVDGEYYLTMEYVQGKTVSRFTRRIRDSKQVMPLGHVLLIGERVCQGLAYAHDATDEHGSPLHLVHRDLSPANVCVSYRGEVKIIDFGAAQSTLKEEQTAPRVVIGNLTYMAPEQARKQLVDRRADIYSTGVMLWELLAWHALPQKGDPVERWRKAANPSWEAPSLHQPGLPGDVDAAILRALKKDPAERYPDAAAFGAELLRLRRKYAPEVTEKDLGALLTLMFKKEKATEDEIIEELLKGQPEETTDKGRAFVVPPTALAFEHRAIAAPPEYVPEPDEYTDPGLPPRPGTPPPGRAISADDLTPTRVGFGVPIIEKEPVEESLLHEIEPPGAGTGEADENEPHTAPFVSRSRKWAYAAVFIAAAAVGFLGSLMWGGAAF